YASTSGTTLTIQASAFPADPDEGQIDVTLTTKAQRVQISIPTPDVPTVLALLTQAGAEPTTWHDLTTLSLSAIAEPGGPLLLSVTGWDLAA
ncbi:hypothetical protein G3I76_57035, partial [Streptomyces sp. SID11233]|nr:hypothetical protein [Streptomyces sp. SID11233]